mgnify:CR=1 FL=1
MNKNYSQKSRNIFFFLTQQILLCNIHGRMKLSLSCALILFPAFTYAEQPDAARTNNFDSADPGTYTDVPYIRGEEEPDSALIAVYLAERLRILSAVQDSASALDAVVNLKLLFRERLSADAAPDTPLNILQMQLASHINRLKDSHFYGVPALAELLNFSPEDALLPSQINDDMLTILRNEAEQNLSTWPAEAMEGIDGGPGLTADTAWIIKTTDSRESFRIVTELASESFADWTICSHRLEVREQRRYLVYTMTLIRDGKKYQPEIWADITASRPVYSEEEQQAALQKIISNLVRMQELMVGISDKASADSATTEMAKLIREITPLREIAETQDTSLMLMTNLAPQFDFEAFRAAAARHREQNCYGSEPLRKFLEAMLGPEPQR